MSAPAALAVPELALLDLDGTLVDTVPDLAFCIDQMLGAMGYEPVGETRVRAWVGDGLDALVRRALQHRLDDEAATSLLADARERCLALYARHTSERSRIYRGVPEGLRFLHAAGSRLGCVTNKAARFAERLLRDLDLRRFFDVVVYGDTLPAKKPDPTPLLHAAAELGLAPARCLLIGDSRNDVKAARAAGFAVICVTYGYNQGVDIRQTRPDAVIDSLADLERVLVHAR